MPLPGHSLEASPCYPIIRSKPGELPTDTNASYIQTSEAFLTEIENHCRQKDPENHKAAILARIEA